MPENPIAADRCLLLFTKPARAGKVKTRLIGELTPRQAAQLHAAFLGDVRESLGEAALTLWIAWALEEDEAVPGGVDGVRHLRQEGGDLGQRLHAGLRAAARHHAGVAAVGSDHPELSPATAEDAFRRLEAGADVVLGPTEDGGYYLIGARREALSEELFRGVAWSTEAVLRQTLERCGELDLTFELLPPGHDIDIAEDLHRLGERLRAASGGCPRTRALLAAWGRLPA